METNNTELWDKVRRVPSEHLQPFNNGKFKGTAIKPMWAIKVMTEIYGPMGTGWGVLDYSYRTEDAGDSRLVFCEMTIWYQTREQTVHGIGGDWLVRNGKGDDEALKKAYTDALTNALKHIGVAADIHMNLWDGSKYKDETPAAANASEKPAAPPTAAKPPPTYDRNPLVKEAFTELMNGIRQCANMGTMEDLKLYWTNNAKKIAAMPADWKQELEELKEEAKMQLEQRAA